MTRFKLSDDKRDYLIHGVVSSDSPVFTHIPAFSASMAEDHSERMNPYEGDETA